MSDCFVLLYFYLFLIRSLIFLRRYCIIFLYIYIYIKIKTFKIKIKKSDFESFQKLVPTNTKQKLNSREADNSQPIYLGSKHMCGFLFSSLPQYNSFPFFFGENNQIQ